MDRFKLYLVFLSLFLLSSLSLTGLMLTGPGRYAPGVSSLSVNARPASGQRGRALKPAHRPSKHVAPLLAHEQDRGLPLQPFTLENEHVRLTWLRQEPTSQTWGLALDRITVKSTGYTFAFDLDDLWAITLRASDASTTTIVPSNATYTLRVITDTVGLTKTLTAVWRDVTPVVPARRGLRPAVISGSLVLTASMTLGPNDRYALWTIGVDNRYADQAVYRIDFPRLKVQPVGTPETNRAVVPYLGGRLIYDPINSVALKTLLWPLPFFFLYPHMYAPLQLFSYFDTADSHTLYLAAHDGRGYTKAFDFRADGQRLFFGVRQFPEYNITPGNNYLAPYAVAVGAMSGDWYDAAKTYRNWALRQDWAQRGPIALSDNFSEKLKASAIMGVWAPITDTVSTASFEAAARDMERWAGFLDTDHVAGLWYGWHGNEFDTGWPEYQPVQPTFPAGMTLTHRLQHYAWPYINPTGWDTATASYTATHAADYALKDEFGHVQTATSTKGAVFALMDPATSFWQEYVRDWVLALQGNYEVDGVYLDVWSGGGYGFDYDPTHGHPTGGGNYLAQGMRTQGQMIRQATRANDSGFIMMSEHPGEVYIDLLEIENVEYVGPLNPAQWWSLPLFNTVYHDYIMMSTFVNTSSQVPDSVENTSALSWMWAVRYIQGNLLAVNGDGAPVLQDPVETTPNYPAYIFLKQLVQSYAYAAPYLRYGERLRDLPTTVPTRSPPSANGIPFAIAPYALQQPVILSSAWRSVSDPSAGSGHRDSVGLIFANWVTTTQAISFTFDPGEYGLPAGPLGLYRLDQAGPHLLTSFSGPITRAETLPGRSLLVLEIAACPHPYDLSGNGVVDVEDVTAVAANWHLPDPNPQADLDQDGDVDVIDIMRAIAEWGGVCPLTPPPEVVQIRVTGPEEVVFDWTTDRCEDNDIPDVPARAFRDAQGRVQLVASHYINRRFIGPDLDHLTHECEVIMNSHYDADPSHFNDHEWIHSLYTLDGSTVYALIHNEYQGHTHPGRCPSGEYFKCWYNAITLAVSEDQGATYSHAQPPDHLVASIPYTYVPDSGPAGIFNPSNIVRSPTDGYYYALLHLEQYQAQDWGACLTRTYDLADPLSWRAWDGNAFSVHFINPYLEPDFLPEDHVCQPVARDEIRKMHESLTFNTYLDRYLLVGATGLFDPVQGRTVWGIYSLSHLSAAQMAKFAPH